MEQIWGQMIKVQGHRNENAKSRFSRISSSKVDRFTSNQVRNYRRIHFTSKNALFLWYVSVCPSVCLSVAHFTYLSPFIWSTISGTSARSLATWCQLAYTRSTSRSPAGEQNKSAVTDHAISPNHVIDWESGQSHRQRKQQSRQMDHGGDAIHIRKEQDKSMNKG